jgi:hypothetical protein
MASEARKAQQQEVISRGLSVTDTREAGATCRWKKETPQTGQVLAGFPENGEIMAHAVDTIEVESDSTETDFSELSPAAWMDLARYCFEPGARKPCQVCGKYRSLTHAHHLVPLSMQAARRPLLPNHEHAWLCPTHHAAVHVLIAHKRVIESQKLSRRRMAVILDLSRDNAELVKVNEIAGRAFA